MTTEKSTFAKNLAKARQLKNWSQEGTARAAGISRKAYAKYEEGIREPKHKVLIRLCEALDILDLRQFLTNEKYFDGKIATDSSNNNLAA